jgi:pimeloyl-ACP methyl ester carboxylesterase
MILFVHGFPECWYSWRNQMKYFSKEYRVVAIDQRGYGLSTKPRFVADYRVEILAGDVADVIEQLGYESCILVGHDWGGLVAWTTAMLYPHLIEKLIIMNCPHPVAFRQELSFKQMRKSWYMFWYQSPLLPELSFQADDFAIFYRLFHKKPAGLVNKDLLTNDDIEVFKYTFSQKGKHF